MVNTPVPTIDPRRGRRRARGGQRLAPGVQITIHRRGRKYSSYIRIAYRSVIPVMKSAMARDSGSLSGSPLGQCLRPELVGVLVEVLPQLAQDPLGALELPPDLVALVDRLVEEVAQRDQRRQHLLAHPDLPLLLQPRRLHHVHHHARDALAVGGAQRGQDVAAGTSS